MTAATHEPVLDVSRTEDIPFPRLVSVELRKTADTRAGRWLLFITAGFIALAMAIFFIVGVTQDVAIDLAGLFQVANVPMGLFVPIIGIIAVTSEWGQRTNMITFTLEPDRLRVVWAKLAAGLVLGVASVLVAVVVGVLTLGVFAAVGGDTDWNVEAGMVAGFVLLQVIGVLTGFAFGMLFLNTPVAIVAYFAYSFILPGIISTGAAIWEWARDLQPWIDFGYAQTPLISGEIGEVHWGQFAVTGFLWFVLPLAFGVWRLLRAEIK